jgi:single-strand DNA-binding protein
MSDLRLPDLNKVTLVGRLTRDPELKYTGTGIALCKMGLAVSRYYKSKDGERKEETTFINVTAWDKAAEYLGEHVKKGRPLLVEGRLVSNEWEDKTTGQKRSTIEVRAERVQQLDWDESRGGAGGGGGGSSSRPQPRAIEEPVPEDDVPF